jgi:hypothetical protein
MPFCTICGANVTGTFCSQCGTPATGAAAPTPQPAAAYPPAAAAPYPQPGAPGVPPVARKTSPIVWVLVIVLGLFLLGGIAVAGFVAFVAHRVHQAGVAFDRNGDGGFTMQTRDKDGKSASLQFGGKGKAPSWVPVYPGSEGKSQFAISGTGDGGEGGVFTFITSDDPERVKSFYSDKARGMGMTLNLDTTTAGGGMIVAAEEGGDRRTLHVTVAGHSGAGTAVTVAYGRQ